MSFGGALECNDTCAEEFDFDVALKMALTGKDGDAVSQATDRSCMAELEAHLKATSPNRRNGAGRKTIIHV